MANDKKHDEKQHDEGAGAAVATAPPPPEPYPAKGYPKVVFSKTDRVPPRIVNNDAELGALDPKQWTQIPPAADPKEPPAWPRYFYNINNPPRLVSSAAAASDLGMNWSDLEEDFGINIKVKPKS